MTDMEREKYKIEIKAKELYLQSTDWMVVKCLERGYQMNVLYPVEYVTRQQYRERVDEIRQLLNQ